MPNTIQVTGDDEPFLIQQDIVDTQLDAVRQQLHGISLTTICLECEEPIGAARKKAVPNATLCIECATAKAAADARR